ncbi:L-rhamnose mutarotase [Nocardiopsis coralliicola]
MERIGQVVRLRPEHREEYIRLHREVWPQVQDQIKASNIADYTIYLYGDLLFSHFVYTGTDFAADMAAMAADPATQRWWLLTDPCQEALPAHTGERPWAPMEEVFHLD